MMYKCGHRAKIGDPQTKAKAFKHILLRAVPISHEAQKSAWMDHELFQQWKSSFPRHRNFYKRKIFLLHLY
jgi:hypothetical protein